MRDFVLKLFREHNSKLEIHLFNEWHLFYLFIVFGGVILLSFFYRSKSAETTEKVLRIIAYLTIGIYVADFFIMPLSDSYKASAPTSSPSTSVPLWAFWCPSSSSTGSASP